MKLDGMKVQSEIVRRRLTITDFAKKAGLPTSTLYRVINGDGRSNTRTAGKIAAALQMNPTEISYSYSAQIKEENL
ncbi:MAG: helix-turn-helix transcriptional regulator [Selenomonadaceae bacterium]|nr:helix-turn-helix transcriptional regulator [Selenomonadaceae bacterium]